MPRTKPLSAHSEKILALLAKSKKPLTAYDILEKLKPAGVKAPPTVYRALQTLMAAGQVHRIETLNAFVACHAGDHAHGSQFAVCNSCGTALEIHDHKLEEILAQIAKRLRFHIEREILELVGLCAACAKRSK